MGIRQTAELAFIQLARDGGVRLLGDDGLFVLRHPARDAFTAEIELVRIVEPVIITAHALTHARSPAETAVDQFFAARDRLFARVEEHIALCRGPR